jgi:hypothetical protein
VLNTTPPGLASQIPLTTSRIETPTARQKPSQTIPVQSSPNPTVSGIDITQALEILPLQPFRVLAESRPGEIRIEWLGTGEDILYYEVLRRVSTSEEWSALDKIEVSGDNLEQYHFTDQMVEPGLQYIYGIVAVNTLGARSLITESDPLTTK